MDTAPSSQMADKPTSAEESGVAEGRTGSSESAIDAEDGNTSTGSAEGTLVATTTQLLKAHTEAIAAQTASQHLPPLKLYTVEEAVTQEDGTTCLSHAPR